MGGRLSSRASLVALMILGLASVVIGIWLEWSVLAGIGVGIWCLALLAWRVPGPASASWRDVSAPTRVPRGEPAAVSIDMTVGPGSTRWVSAADPGGTQRVMLESGSGHAGARVLTWPVDTSRRGIFHVGASRLEVRDPFGVRSRVLATRDPFPVLVVPRVDRVPSISGSPSPRDEDRAERAGSETFHSLREYVVGDPMKGVHWRASAHTGTLMVRRLVDTTVPWLVVILDVNARAFDRATAMFEDFDAESFEQAVDAAASRAWHGCGSGQRVLLTTTSLVSAKELEVTARTRESALDWLALVECRPSAECGAGRVTALLRRHAVSRAVFLSGARVEQTQAWVRQWRQIATVDTQHLAGGTVGGADPRHGPGADRDSLAHG